jgi:hypothetical protein
MKLVGRIREIGFIDLEMAIPRTIRGAGHEPSVLRSQLARAGVLAFALAVCLVFVLLAASVASAGSWMEVSCVNPNQSAAPSEGWSSFATGAPGYGSNNGTGCGPGSPMFALLSTAAAAGVGTGENLHYTPPSGSTLIGGAVDVTMYADGGGYNASGTAVAYTPNLAYDGSDVFFQCARGLTPCANGTDDFSGVLELPGDRGGGFYIGAGCGGTAGYTCNEGGSEGAWALVRLWWANFLLSSEAAPTGSGVGGPLLSANAEGIADLTLNAGDPGGPGVYLVVVQVERRRSDVRLQPAVPGKRVGGSPDQHSESAERPARAEGDRPGRGGQHGDRL